MALTPPLEFAASIARDESDYAQKGRFVDGDRVRPVDGRWQPIGGWELVQTNLYAGTCRALAAWADANLAKYLGVGTNSHLYVALAGGQYDVTPAEVRATGTLGANPFTTSSGSATVTVAAVAHVQVVGNTVQFWGAAAGNGVTIDGAYKVQTVPTADTFTITHSANATGSGATGGAAVKYNFFRATLAGPFDTTNASATVTVNHTAHGRAVGDRVIFDGASAGGGITISGEYTVVTAATNSYTITHSSAATSTAAGTGGTVGYIYLLAVGPADATGRAGYGTGAYGTGGYGASSGTGTTPPRTCALTNIGQDMLANPRGKAIYWWARNTALRAVPVPNAPARVEHMLVDPRGPVVALGCTLSDGSFDPLAIRTSDDDDFTVWTEAQNNIAGEFILGVGSRIVAGLPALGQNLIWTDTALFGMVFTGDTGEPYTYPLLGEKCGLAGPKAAAAIGGAAFWLGADLNFWMYDGGAPRIIPCPSVRYFRDGLNAVQIDKVVCGINSRWSEVWWLYPKLPATEVSHYLAYNWRANVWFDGTLARPAWLDGDIFANPIAAGTDGYLYFHERGRTANGAALGERLESAPFDLGDGNQTMDCFGLVPDVAGLVGTLQITLTTQDWPMETVVTETAGPYDITAGIGRIDARVAGRQMSLSLASTGEGAFWRWAGPRLDLQPAGWRI